MRDESPDRAALIRAGRAAFRPDPSDRERVLQSLTGALGAGALVDGARHAKLAKSVAPASSAVPAWVLGGLGALAIGGAVVVAAHPVGEDAVAGCGLRRPLAALGRADALVPHPAPGERRRSSCRTAARGRPVRAHRKPVARSSAASTLPDSLPEEVRVLSRAEQQLNSGHADEALRTLAEHERRFPSGALAEERMAARVQALCALGRLAAARAELARFAQAYPRSPHLDRARRLCVLDAP